MSLVGPRPERPEFVPRLEQAIPLYRERLLVRPGVTGLAQVQLPPDTDLFSAIHAAVGKLEKQALRVREKWRDSKRVPRKETDAAVAREDETSKGPEDKTSEGEAGKTPIG